MDMEEVLCFRVPQFFQMKIKGHFQKMFRPIVLEPNKSFVGPSYSIVEIQSLFKAFPFNNEYKIFTEKIDILDFEDWRKDVSTGISSSHTYYGYITRQNHDKNGDIKFVSEISRLQFLPFLAFKAIESEDPKYLDRLEELLMDWNDQNPYLKSINWTSGIEVAIRVVNLIYTHYILTLFQKLSGKVDLLLMTIISHSYQFLKSHLSLYSSGNNHLMAELMGLNVVGSYLKTTKKEIDTWKNMFFEQIGLQTNEDGVNMELCTRYHAEVTDHILIAFSFLQGAGHKIPEQTREKYKKMFRFTEHVEFWGNDTVFGDNDEGSVINPYFDEEFSLYKSQLQTCNFLYQTEYKSNGKVDFRNYLIFGSKYNANEIDFPEQDTLFDESGYCFLYDHKTRTKLSFDCGNIGDDISAAHGHSDIFHFNLDVGGMPFLIDSGTFQYHTKYKGWRDYFRGITAHNTISINKKNHALNNGRMSWTARPKTRIETASMNSLEPHLLATTNAFAEENIVLSRGINFYKNQNKIVIRDLVDTKRSTSYELLFYLHFQPNTSIKHKGKVVELERENIKVELINDYFRKAQFVCGQEQPILGWFSKQFGHKEQTSCLKFSVNLQGECEIETTILYG